MYKDKQRWTNESRMYTMWNCGLVFQDIHFISAEKISFIEVRELCVDCQVESIILFNTIMAARLSVGCYIILYIVV